MIEIKVNINNMSSHVDINSLTRELANAIESFSGGNVHTNINLRDDKSMSPLGIYTTKEYMKIRDKL